MRATIFSLILAWLCSGASLGAPAYPKPHNVATPDGKLLTVVGHGDEFSHYTTTTDGYTVMKASNGYYYYAHKQDDHIVASRVLANNPDNRVNSETKFLSRIGKGLVPQIGETAKKIQQQQLMMQKNPMKLRHGSGTSSDKHMAAVNVGENYRGLVLLVNFNDRKFSQGNDESYSIYTDMINKKSYTGYNDKNHGWQDYTGSVYDYFADNSYNLFTPEFDIVGPIDVDCSQYYINGVENTYQLVEKVLKTADPLVDYSRYDADNDGEIDMIYIIYAGYSSSYAGNDERMVWPHAGSMADYEDSDNNLYLDGKLMGRFACSTELYGWQSDNDEILDGIGVICHEFSHVLGFSDHYDTAGTNQEDPYSWDVMASGCYNGSYNRTPCGYNAYEKYSAGFLQPILLNDMAGETVKMKSLETSADAYMIRSNQENVFFMLENRQADKWDAGLVGHGMLVWRVDSTDARYWEHNVVNTIERTCFRLVRACGTQGNNIIGVIDEPFDPFPGTYNVTELTNETDKSNLITYDKIASPVVIINIGENNREISFMVKQDNESDDLPISYDLHEKYTVEAEQLIDNEWKPVTWTMSRGELRLDNGDYYDVLYNFLPNTENINRNTNNKSNELAFVYTTDYSGRNIKLEAQRLMINSDYGIWICNFTDVDNQGAGGINLKISRHGIPIMENDSAEIGYCSMQPSAYIVTNKKILSRLSVFRNLIFREWDGEVTDIKEISTEKQHTASPYIYNIQGQRVSANVVKAKKGIYIINGKKVLK